MPNQPATPLHSYRADDELVQAVKARAEDNGETVTDVIVRALKAYLRENP